MNFFIVNKIQITWAKWVDCRRRAPGSSNTNLILLKRTRFGIELGSTPQLNQALIVSLFVLTFNKSIKCVRGNCENGKFKFIHLLIQTCTQTREPFVWGNNGWVFRIVQSHTRAFFFSLHILLVTRLAMPQIFIIFPSGIFQFPFNCTICVV